MYRLCVTEYYIRIYAWMAYASTSSFLNRKICAIQEPSIIITILSCSIYITVDDHKTENKTPADRESELKKTVAASLSASFVVSQVSWQMTTGLADTLSASTVMSEEIKLPMSFISSKRYCTTLCCDQSKLFVLVNSRHISAFPYHITFFVF